MRLPRVRFTVRRMMVAVAVIAVTVWFGLLVWRSSQSLTLSPPYRLQPEVYFREKYCR